jgi:membrane associated rhomboid family serine protease
VGAAAKEKKSAVSDTLQKYKQILPLTRIYISMVGIVTLVGMILGEELTQELMALDPLRVLYGLELWRPLTAACFLGPPSVGWLMSGYYLFQYGSTLERAYGTAQHLIFILTQIVFLSILSALLGQPFFAPSIITAMLHVLSRSMPHQKVKWLVFTVPYWALPYGLMATDVLQAGSPMAALPHVLGIISGHFYHFHKFIWPKMGGEDWLVAPDFLVQRLDPNAKKSTKDVVNISLKRKRGKGRKLGK